MPFAGTKKKEKKRKKKNTQTTKNRDDYAVMELELVRNVFYSLSTADRLYPPKFSGELFETDIVSSFSDLHPCRR